MSFSARLAVVALAAVAPALGQQILFAENFAAGIPPTWSHLALGVPIDPWSAGTSPATQSADVFHEWFCLHGGQNRNNILLTPPIDLRGFTRVDFSCVQHQTFPLLRSVNRVEVSTDGGQTFVMVYEENGTWSGPGTIQVSLDAFAGAADLRIGFHYEGAVANEWRIDDVRVTSPQPGLAVQGLTAGGTASFVADGCTPGAFVVFGLSIAGPGPLPSPWGPVGLTPPIELLPAQIASGSGTATATLPIPAAAVGIPLFAQAVDFPLAGPIRLSNARAATVQ
jgi:hypothetical protein